MRSTNDVPTTTAAWRFPPEPWIFTPIIRRPVKNWDTDADTVLEAVLDVVLDVETVDDEEAEGETVTDTVAELEGDVVLEAVEVADDDAVLETSPGPMGWQQTVSESSCPT